MAYLVRSELDFKFIFVIIKPRITYYDIKFPITYEKLPLCASIMLINSILIIGITVEFETIDWLDMFGVN